MNMPCLLGTNDFLTSVFVFTGAAFWFVAAASLVVYALVHIAFCVWYAASYTAWRVRTGKPQRIDRTAVQFVAALWHMRGAFSDRDSAHRHLALNGGYWLTPLNYADSWRDRR